jgi:hypothetical protein
VNKNTAGRGNDLPKMSEKPAPSLLSLPTEIIQLILSYIPSQYLSQNVEMTCKKLRKAMIPVYRVTVLPEIGVTTYTLSLFLEP